MGGIWVLNNLIILGFLQKTLGIISPQAWHQSAFQVLLNK